MPDDASPPVPVWSVKFFHDLRSLTPSRLPMRCRCGGAQPGSLGPIDLPPQSRQEVRDVGLRLSHRTKAL